jgi:ribose 5-phosphate isomerase A
MMDELKRQAAIAALEGIKDGMVVGLGSGSTASHFIRELGGRVRAGLRIVGIPSSEESRRLAEGVGVPLTTLLDHPGIDVTVDGADEVSERLDLTKGLGGALVREKIVAHASERIVIVVDETKMVDKLGRKTPIPVEVIPLASPLVLAQLKRWGGEASPREKDGKVFGQRKPDPRLALWGGGSAGGSRKAAQGAYRCCGLGHLRQRRKPRYRCNVDGDPKATETGYLSSTLARMCSNTG